VYRFSEEVSEEVSEETVLFGSLARGRRPGFPSFIVVNDIGDVNGFYEDTTSYTCYYGEGEAGIGPRVREKDRPIRSAEIPAWNG
jgi:hypothetical protein